MRAKCTCLRFPNRCRVTEQCDAAAHIGPEIEVTDGRDGLFSQAQRVVKHIRCHFTWCLPLIEADTLLLLAEASPASERDACLDRAEAAIERTGYAYRRPDLDLLRAGESAVAKLRV